MQTDLNPQAPPPEPRFDFRGVVPPALLLEPGIYFDLDEDVYHRSFALSYSGIKHFRISPYNWWVRSPLNPRQADVLAEEASDAKDMGKAFDARIVGGKSYFYSRYVPAISHSEPAYKDSLRTADDMKEYLEKLGQKKSGAKAELISRILSADPTARIWDVIEDGYRKMHEGKEFLDFGLIEKIEMAAIMIESHPELGKAFRDGAPQVSIVWYCEKTGVPCRVRYDYLKPKVITDLKTLQPKDEMPLEQAIGREIGFRKYYIQASYYLEAAAMIPQFIKEGRVFGRPPEGFLDKLKKHKEKEWLWIFQLKGVAPVAKGRLLSKESHLLQLGEIECDNAKHKFRSCLETYGAAPWVDPEPIKTMDDADIPAWSLI